MVGMTAIRQSKVRRNLSDVMERECVRATPLQRQHVRGDCTACSPYVANEGSVPASTLTRIDSWSVWPHSYQAFRKWLFGIRARVLSIAYVHPVVRLKPLERRGPQLPRHLRPDGCLHGVARSGYAGRRARRRLPHSPVRVPLYPAISGMPPLLSRDMAVSIAFVVSFGKFLPAPVAQVKGSLCARFSGLPCTSTITKGYVSIHVPTI